MRSVRREEVLPNVLEAGDSISVTMSHQMYIDGDQTWLTVKIGGRQVEEETSHDAYKRIEDMVMAGIRSTVKSAVENVREISGQEEEE